MSDVPPGGAGPSPEPAGPSWPALWNPNVAANWSLVLTPIFGAYLHGRNWRALGKPERATANMVWVWVTAAFLLANIVTLFLPDSELMTAIMRGGGIGILLGWYVTLGRAHIAYVKASLPSGYIKKSWGRPLAVGIGGVVVYLALAFVIAIFARISDPKELATQVKPLILREWQKRPEFREATIQHVSLVRKGGRVYTGFVDATLGGQPARLVLDVVLEGGTIAWEVKRVAR